MIEVLKNLQNVTKIPELKRRLLVTAGLLAAYRLGAHVPTPGVDAEALARFFDSAQLSSDWDSLKEADVELLVNSLSILCPFDPEEKQALLEAPTLTERRETLVTLMEFALRSGGDEGAIQ